jgi:internalin A
MPAVPVPRPWRKFLRFSVRGLIVVVLLIGVWLGWLVRSARIQHEAVAAIEKVGGSVSYDWGWSNGKSIPGGKPWAPRWFVDLIGVDYFGHVTIAWLSPPLNATNATLAAVGRLTRLERLVLIGTSADDAGLAHLKGLAKLSSLNLGFTQVTDAGLAHLKGLNNLSILTLRGTNVTDAGLAHLKGLGKLSSLNLSFTHVKDAGIAELKRASPSLNITR